MKDMKIWSRDILTLGAVVFMLLAGFFVFRFFQSSHDYQEAEPLVQVIWPMAHEMKRFSAEHGACAEQPRRDRSLLARSRLLYVRSLHARVQHQWSAAVLPARQPPLRIHHRRALRAAVALAQGPLVGRAKSPMNQAPNRCGRANVRSRHSACFRPPSPRQALRRSSMSLMLGSFGDSERLPR